jgi:alkylation response protein AidB-like acyl-CoA dehydrogenase
VAWSPESKTPNIPVEVRTSSSLLHRQTATVIGVCLVEVTLHETATGAALLAAAPDFRPRVIAQRDAIETSRRLPDDLARELARRGFFRIFLPAAYGGLDLTPMDGIAVFEELAKTDASVAWCVWNGNTHWIAAQQAHVVDGGYRLTGRGSLVSGCEFATWMVLWSVIHEDGKPRTTPSVLRQLDSGSSIATACIRTRVSATAREFR